MFAKRLLQKATHHPQKNLQHDVGVLSNLDLHIAVHYGLPPTASLLAFDPIQGLLAIGTLDGRIKVIGGDNIEALLISPKKSPFKFLEFLQNKGILVSISNDNDIQVWNLESRCLACYLQWESNVTAFAPISGSDFMYVGDEYGMTSVLKHEAEDGKLLQLPYCISENLINEAAGSSILSNQPIVGVLPQPCSSGNRVLIAYQNGLILLWDVSEDRIIFVKGDKDLKLKEDLAIPKEVDASLPDDTAEHHLEEKEISALCWASADGSILAVGYVDGDVLFWDTFNAAPIKGQQTHILHNVVKLQLSSSKRRLPIILLRWSKNDHSLNNHDGQLFIYGGDEIGSEEVLTVLSLEWSSPMENLRCVGRVNLPLNGSFADMMLLPPGCPTGSKSTIALFLLTNPGQLHFYEDASMSGLTSQKEGKPISSMKFPTIIPTVDPHMTVSKLCSLSPNENSSRALSKIASVDRKPGLAGVTWWPLTGGLCSQLSSFEDNGVKRLFIGGYHDGSARIWDATFPVLTLICVIEDKVDGMEIVGSGAPLLELEFCCFTSNLAVGNNCGLVRLFNCNDNSDQGDFHFVTDSKHEVHRFTQAKGFQCTAVFSLLNSPVNSLQFTSHGGRLAVGYECGHVAVLDMSSLAVLFLTDSVSGSTSPILSLTWQTLVNNQSLVKTPESSENMQGDTMEEFVFVLRNDATVSIVDGDTGKALGCWPLRSKNKSTAISMYVIEGIGLVSGLSNEKQQQESSKDTAEITQLEIKSHNIEHHSSEATSQSRILPSSFVLICFEDSVRFYHSKSVIQGQTRPFHKVKLSKPCRWTCVFRRNEKDYGLVLLYQDGEIEIRSLLNFELVNESSLMSILRWNFKTNMEKLMSSDNQQITLVNGCEVAFILMAAEDNDYRILRSLPCLHDKVVAAAAAAAISTSHNQKEKQGGSKILASVVKGIKGKKDAHHLDVTTTADHDFTHLEVIFSRTPSADPSQTNTNDQAMEFDIDDIEIDEPLFTEPTTSSRVQDDTREKSEREKLLQGGSSDFKPRLRTPEEIMATYRKAGDASSVAAHAKDKLVQRQEKLERINRRTEELKNGAEDFPSLANELVKTMEGRKWWKI